VPRPGVDVIVGEDFAPGGPALNTGAGFIVGPTEKGPAAVPTQVMSFRSYKETFGSLSGGSDMYKAAYAFFNEGGLYLTVVRAVGSGATAASGTATGWLDVDATSPGSWGDDLDVAIDPQAASNPVTYVVTVTEDGVVKEQSLPLEGPEVAAFKSKLVTFTELATPTYPPESATTVTVSLSGGANGSAPGDTELTAALNTITYAYGPGQVAFPGETDSALHAALGEHCVTNDRVGLVDLIDTPDPAQLKSAVAAIQSGSPEGAKRLLPLGSLIEYPGETPPVVWDTPYSGVQMGEIARVDGLNDPSLLAAGSNGISRLATGYKRDFTDDEREDLNYAGVALPKVVNGRVRTYGYRTAAGLSETNWVFFQEARVVMGVAHEADAVLEEFVLKTIDGRGKIFTRVNVALTGVCQRYWRADALFGETPAEAFAVDTSYPGINTVDTVAAGEIHAQIRLRTSRIGEWVVLNIIKVPLQRPVAA
jgi:hypothetical protein